MSGESQIKGPQEEKRIRCLSFAKVKGSMMFEYNSQIFLRGIL